jgi:hypothetical protein
MHRRAVHVDRDRRDARLGDLRKRGLGLVVLAAVVTLSACGSGSGSGTAATPTGHHAVELIASSADKAAAAKTARIGGEVTVTTQGGTKTLPLDGALDFGSGAFEFTYDLSKLGLPGASGAKIQARMVDGVMYMNLGDLAGSGGKGLESMTGGKSWIKLDLGSLGLGAPGASGGLSDANPSGTLDLLRGAGDVQKVGTETLRGVETTHYRATIDPQQAVDKAPDALRGRVQQGLGAINGPIPVDVWIDGDGQARKIAMSVDAKTGKIATSIEYYDFGTDVSVQAPPASDTFDFSDMLGGLRQLTGGAGTAAT